MRIVLVLATLMLASFPSTPPMPIARIGWTLPTTYTDGSSLDRRDLSAINVYETNPRRLMAVRPGRSTSYTAVSLRPGMHCFFVTAVVDTIESDDGQVVCKLVR